MPRHYTDEEKRLVLDRLIANHGDVPRTAAECGVNERNIYVWRKDSKFADLGLLNLKNPTNFPNPISDSPSLYTERGLGGEVLNSVEVLPPETTEAFQTLHDKLLTILTILTNSIEEAIPESPLNQRVAAVSQIMNTITKINALLPEPDDDEDDDGKPFEIDYDVEPKEDDLDDQNQEEEKEAFSPSAAATSPPEEDSREYRPL